MANPQKENGHIDIANELGEAFAKYFPGHSEGKILWAILRKTYGWHKKEDYISITQIMEMTKISRRMVIYSLQNLEAKKMITIKRKRGRGIKNEINQISLQKNYDLWVVQEKSFQYRKALQNRKQQYQKSNQLVVQETGGSARNEQLVVQETEFSSASSLHSQKKFTKETIQKKNIYSRVIQEIINYLNQKAGKNYRMNNQKTKSLIQARLREGFTLDDFKKVIDTKVQQWQGKVNKDGVSMETYLRPETLFGTKFESYLNEPEYQDQEWMKYVK